VSVPYTYGALICMYDGTSQNVSLNYKFTAKERDSESGELPPSSAHGIIRRQHPTLSIAYAPIRMVTNI
jgi:hypothetical protein